MNTIHKYTAPPKPGRYVIKTKKNACLLKVANQHDLITFWFQEDTDEEETEDHVFMFLHTEDVFTDHDLFHTATVLTHGGNTVIHVFIWVEN